MYSGGLLCRRSKQRKSFMDERAAHIQAAVLTTGLKSTRDHHMQVENFYSTIVI